MRSVLQRVDSASVQVAGEVVGEIGPGLVVLAGVEKGDGSEQMILAARRIVEMRIFADEAGKMNLDVRQAGGAILAVSQFTLAASIDRGRRPGFASAEDPERAAILFGELVAALESHGVRVATGRFGAHMRVSIDNDGPVTFVLDVRP